MFGTTVEFQAANDVEVYFYGARPSKDDCIVIGYNYFNAVAAADEKMMDKMLDDLGPVLVRRSLRAFANYAKRDGQPEVGKFVETLRNDITVVSANAKTA